MSRIHAGICRALAGLLASSMILMSMPVTALADEVAFDAAEEQIIAEPVEETAELSEAEIAKEQFEDELQTEAEPAEEADFPEDDDLQVKTEYTVSVNGNASISEEDGEHKGLVYDEGSFYIDGGAEEISFKLVPDEGKTITEINLSDPDEYYDYEISGYWVTIRVNPSPHPEGWFENIAVDAETETAKLSVSFQWNSEQVDLSVEGISSGSVSVEYGKDLTFTAAAKSDYKIDSVKANGTEVTSSENSYTITGITENITVIIESSSLTQSCTVELEYEDEQVTVSYAYPELTDDKTTVKSGENFDFSLDAKTGFKIDSVKANNTEIYPEDGYYSLTITENTTIVITCKEDDGKKTVTFIIDEGVQITDASPALSDNKIVVEEGGTAKFKIKAKAGFKIKTVKFEEDEIGWQSNFYRFENILFDFTITVVSEKETVDLTFKYEDSSNLKIFAYDSAAGKGEQYELNEKKIKVQKSNAFSFCLEVPDEASQITEVKAGTKKIAAAEDKTHSCEFYTIAASDLSRAATVTVTVKSSKITSVSLKGFKGTKDAPYVEQTLGTVAEYPITINKDGDIDRLSFSLTGTNAGAEIVKKEKETVLVVSNYSYDQTNETYDIEKGDIKVQFKDVDTAVGPEFTIKAPEKFKIAKPAVKIVKVSDVKVRVSVTVPKSCPALTYCRIVATRKTDDPSGTMKPDVVKNCKLSDQFEEDLVLSDNAPGMGKAAKYDISACLVQVDAYTGDPDVDVAEGKVTRSGDEAKVTAATVDSSYETKLSLGKKTTTFIAGQKNILLATAKFGSKTSFTSLGSAELIDSTGIQVLNSASGGIVFNGDEIILPDSAALEPGKYTLNVYPLLPEGTYAAPATVAITVQMPIYDIAVSVPATKVYKGNNKAATVKTTVTLNHGLKEQAPASKKLDWKVVYANGGSPAPATVTVKNGTVSISKDYAYGADNSFRVIAAAADYEGNTADDGYADFTIINDALAIKSIAIGDLDLSKEQLSSALINKDIVAKDAGGNELASTDYTIKVSDTKNFIVEGRTIKSIKKPGTYTLTVTAEDGGKSSVKQTVTVQSTEAYKYELKAYYYNDYGPIDKIESYATDYPLDIDRPDASIEGYGYMLLESTALTNDDTVFVNAASFKLKNATKVTEWLSDDGYTRYQVVKLAGEKDAKITHSYKIGRDKFDKEYTVKSGITETVKLKPAKGENLEFYANSHDIAYDFYFDFGDYDLPIDDSDSSIEFYPSEDSLKNEYNWRLAQIFEYYCWGNLIKITTGDKTVWRLSVPEERLNGFPKGTYKIYASLYDEDADVNVSPLVALTFKAVDAKKPSGKIDSAKNKRIEIENKKDAYAELPIAPKYCIGYEQKSGSSLNNNQGGAVNKFSKLFKVVVGKVEGGKVVETYDFDKDAKLYLVRTDAEYDSPDDCIGWAEYTMIGNDGFTKVTARDCIYVALTESAPVD